MGPLTTYPGSKPEFNRIFATEADCLSYVAALRWPEGFRCGRCGHNEAWLTAENLWKCKHCGHRQSPTAGTLLHRTHYPLKTWLDVAWHVCEQKNGVSALGLQRAMNFGSYHTAWEWLHRMRRAMVLPSRSQLNGEVEVDETFVGGVKPGKRGRGAAGKALVLVAAEVRGTAIGRIRLRVIPDATANTLLDTTQELVEPGSNVVTDGLSSYAGLAERGYNHTTSRHTPEIGRNLLPKAHRVASLLKRWILGTHQGAISNDLLQYYLDEFVFRFNRRTANSRGLLFSRLTEQFIRQGPIHKNELTSAHKTMQTKPTHHAKALSPPRLPKKINTARGLVGVIFPGQFLGTFCFAPEACLKNGRPDRITYLRSGWATRNGRLNKGGCIGSHLFPREGSAPIAPKALPQIFLRRLERETA